jgi:hypothetical protein
VTGATVIIDECSMLTEEMMGALTETIALAKRVIFIGDPNQLPPIGAGKPFFDLAEYLEDKCPQRLAKLNISNRQKSNQGERLDVELSKLFTFNQAYEVGDDIFNRLSKDKSNIEFVKFDSDIGLNELILNILSKATEMSDINDIVGFDKSLGGTIEDNKMVFNNVRKVDAWQILSPYRNDAISGSLTMNRLIHEKYRPNNKGDTLRWWTNNVLGNDGIVYGDKIINIKNQTKQSYPKEEGLDYIANGEIGIVDRIENDSHRLKFSSQPDGMYYFPSKISDSDSDLELAYALTVHKSQGSGFGTTILIINEPENGISSFLSREMIYTALTRQANKIFILYNKEPLEIKKYSDTLFSNLALRLTNLFDAPVIRKYKDRFYSNGLIYITRTGERVRSKSEVIIYNELDNAKVSFEYEKLLVLPNGLPYSPDFTIYGPDGKVKKYWEHLGILSNSDYNKKQKIKLANYKEFGISEKDGNLIITKDEPNRSINSSIIADIVKILKEYE